MELTFFLLGAAFGANVMLVVWNITNAITTKTTLNWKRGRRKQ